MRFETHNTKKFAHIVSLNQVGLKLTFVCSKFTLSSLGILLCLPFLHELLIALR